MLTGKRKLTYYRLAFQKHDFRASLTVFLVALPLCLGVALASGAPVSAGLVAGVVGGLVVPVFSRSELSVSGPAAGLTAICAAAIHDLGSLEVFFAAVALSGLLQAMLGALRLGGFTHFIPSAVIKGMLAGIGVILISKQVPLLLGYNRPDFWRHEFFNIVTLNHGFEGMDNPFAYLNLTAFLLGLATFGTLFAWKKLVSPHLPFLPASFAAVVVGSLAAWATEAWLPGVQLDKSQFVYIPSDALFTAKLPDWPSIFANRLVWQTAVVICLVASLETLLSVEAVDKLDPFNRISPPNRELMAQGAGNFVSGLLGGLPLTAVIVRSSANVEAGGKTRLSAVAHGLWLLVAVLFAAPLLGRVPYCVLAVLLIRTGWNLAKPSGIGYSVYFLIKHTYRAGFVMEEKTEGGIRHFDLKLALNVSFLNKRRLAEALDRLPEYSVVRIDGAASVYIDHDILEIVQRFRAKARAKHIELHVEGVRQVETIEVH